MTFIKTAFLSILRFALRTLGNTVESIAKKIAKVSDPSHSPVTALFMGICCLVYIIPIHDYMRAFCLNALIEHLWDWTWWVSLPLSMVSHANFQHLIGNLFFIGIIGPKVERELGARYTAILMVVAGAGGSLFWALDGNMDHSGLGASGVLFALLGAIIVLSKNKLITYFGMASILAVAVTEFVARLDPMSRTAHGVHFYAFACGIICTLWFIAFRKDRLPRFKESNRSCCR